MTKLLNAALAAAALLSAPAYAAPRPADDARLSRMLAGRVAGEPVSCLPQSLITSSQIVEGRAIVYRVGSRLYVNEPRSGAGSLDRDDILVTRTTGSQLCSSDVVRLIDQTSRFQRGFVVLDRFVPYKRDGQARTRD